MSEDLVYPTAAEVRAIHADVVAGRADSEPGVRTPRAIEGALADVSEGHFGQAPEGVHETAAELIRRLVAEHPFVDGNKRTALAAAVVLYDLNGLALDYDGEPIRSLLKRFGVDAEAVPTESVAATLRDWTREHGQGEEAPERARTGTGPADDERRRLRERALSAADEADRQDAVRELAALDRERNAETYDRLARE